jgi:hypothetical protein
MNELIEQGKPGNQTGRRPNESNSGSFSLLIRGEATARRLHENPALRRFYAFLRKPLVVALFATIVYFVVFLVFLHPGYETDDDISIISLASGYLGGRPLPFLVFSNILWGFLLNSLYALHIRINWEVLLFFGLNFISTTSLTYVLLSRPWRGLYKLFGVLVTLIADAYFLVNINFTTMAAFASISGFCVLLTGVKAQTGLRNGLFFLGSALVLAGSLIRIEAMLLALALVLPPAVFCSASFKRMNLILALAITGGLVAGSYAYDRSYVQSSPEWNAYYLYNQTRSMLHDTPRLGNIDTLYQKVGWSQNDLVMFTHWFFPDAKTYSLAHLQVLIKIVPDKRTSLLVTLRIFLGGLADPAAIPYLLVIAAIWLATLADRSKKRALPPFLVLTAISLGLGGFLAWSQKLPNRALLSLLAAFSIYCLFILDWTGLFDQHDPSILFMKSVFPRYAGYCAGLLMVSAVGLVMFESINTSRTHLVEQATYERIVADLASLQKQGKIVQNALIVSPGSGIPIEWSSPVILDFPSIQYLPMGWLTFSPAYESVLKQFGGGPLPAEFFQTENVYLLTHPNLMFGVRRFVHEHSGIEITTNVIYRMPNPSGDSAYDDLVLYSVDQKGN